MIKEEAKPIPNIDINAPIKAPIEESTEYEMGVTPKNKALYVLGIFGLMVIILLTCSLLVFYLTGFKGKSEDKSIKITQQGPQKNEKSTNP